MVRRLVATILRLLPVLLYVASTAGCGGSASSDVTVPKPPPPAGPVVSGTVSLPNGKLALLDRSIMERFAALVIEKAEALVATNVKPVARNVAVLLSLQRPDGNLQTFDTFYTNDQGGYILTLPSGTSEDTCRFVVSVGSGETLTRAFVFSTVKPINIDYVSETAVGLIMDQVNQGADLCEFSVGEIEQLGTMIRNLPGIVTGADVFETNRNALVAAASDPDIEAFVQAAGGVPTPVPTQTPLAPTDTPTVGTPSVTPTVTITKTRVPTNTPANTPTFTVTRTITPIPTVTQTRTLTATVTKPPATATATPTNTATPPPTSTQSPTVPISLDTNGSNAVSIAPLDIDFQPAVLSFDSCTSAVSGKTITAGLQSATRLTITLLDNVPDGESTVLPLGTIINCTFTISAGAGAGSTPLTFVRAVTSDVDSNELNATGTSGAVSVTAPATNTPTLTPTPVTTPATVTARLSSGISASDTSLPLDDISQFPDSGTVMIGQELISYNGKQASAGAAAGQPGMLLNVQRGVNGTTPQAHGADDIVALIPAGTSVNVGSANGSPDSNVTIGVTLVTGGAQVAATSNDIVYDSTQVDVALNGENEPDCTINPAIAPGTAASKSLSVGQPTSPATAKILRVGVLATANVNLIPDGSLFTCNFHILGGATLGVKTLANTPRASDASRNLIPVSGTDGTITVVQQLTPTPTPTQVPSSSAINLDSVTGAAGDVVTISATLAGSNDQFAATSTDLVYDSTQVDVALNGENEPDCMINPAIAPGTAASKSLSIGQPTSPATAKILRVGVLATDNVNLIPDGLLFTCHFQIAAGASTGAKVLQNTSRASDPVRNLSTLGGSNGIITVAPAINLNSVSGAAGDVVTIAATLVSSNDQFAATSTDLVYDSTQVDVALNGENEPDCMINPAIAPGTTASKSLSIGQPASPATAKILRVGVLATDNVNIIPDGLLFTCNFSIAPTATAGVIVLQNTPRASDPSRTLFNLGGSNGNITVQ
jgi:hypothetical protein